MENIFLSKSKVEDLRSPGTLRCTVENMSNNSNLLNTSGFSTYFSPSKIQLRSTKRGSRLRFWLLAFCALVFFLITTLLLFQPCFWTGRTVQNIVHLIYENTILQFLDFSRQCEGCNRINFKYSEVNSEFCDSQEIHLLVLVISHPNNTVERQSIRDTWASVQRPQTVQQSQETKSLFILGKSGVPSIDSAVALESQHEGDMIIVDMMEQYSRLGTKSLAALTWALQHCQGAKFYLKTDDDCYNNPGKYSEYLKTHEIPMDFIGGHCFTTVPHRQTSNKWHISHEEYNLPFLPTFCGGPAYLLSATAARKLVQVAVNTRNFSLEDVWLTGFCRLAAGISYVQLPGYYSCPDIVDKCDLLQDAFTIHRVKPVKMYSLWEKFKEIKGSTRQEQCYVTDPQSISLIFWIFSMLVMILIVHRMGVIRVLIRT